MAEREWKPGDVALVRLQSRVDGRSLSDGWAVAIRDNVGGWACGAATHRWVSDDKIDDARPLVVIDPEDRDQIERLLVNWPGPEVRIAGDVDLMQACFREFANPTPPKPDEPTGLGAVVVDADGTLYLRTVISAERPWARLGERGITTYVAYDDTTAVRVLSEGIQ